jgi:hypothetical protein
MNEAYAKPMERVAILASACEAQSYITGRKPPVVSLTMEERAGLYSALYDPAPLPPGADDAIGAHAYKEYALARKALVEMMVKSHAAGGPLRPDVPLPAGRISGNQLAPVVARFIKAKAALPARADGRRRDRRPEPGGARFRAPL